MFGTPTAEELAAQAKQKAENDKAYMMHEGDHRFGGNAGYSPTGAKEQYAGYAAGQTYGGQNALYDKWTGEKVVEDSARQEAAYYRKQAQDAQNRAGVRVDTRDSDASRAAFRGAMGQSNASRAMQLGAYGQQQDVADRYGAMARGEGPSLASALMSQGQNNIRAAQTSAAASARGPAALAMAQQNAAGNMAAQGQQLNAQLGQMRNQEQMQAMQGYGQSTQALQAAASGVRGQDFGAAGLYNQAAAQDAQRAQAQAQFEAQQRALNDVRSAQNEAGVQNVNTQAMQGSLQGRALDQGMYQMNQQAHQAAQARSDAITNALIGAGGAIGGSLIAGPVGGALGGAAASGATQAATSPATSTNAAAAPAAGSSPAPQPSYFDSSSTSGTATPITYVPPTGSDMRSKQKIASLSDALMRSQAAMYGSPAAVGVPTRELDPDSRMYYGRNDATSNEARRMFNAQEAMYGAPSPIRETLRSTEPYAFNYKPSNGYGEDPSQRHVGIMAQDLEKTPAGSTIVKDTPKGKMIDGKQAVGFNLAAAADLQKQIDALKAERMAQSQTAMYSAPVAVRGQ